MADRSGQQIGNYRLLKLLGSGGFAEVYLAEQVYVGTLAAVKLLTTQLGPEEVAHFREEARAVAVLKHPNIVRMLDFGVEGNIPYLVMEYASQGTLRERFPRGTPLPAATILPYIQQIGDALQYAHDQRLVHRDVKPENMLLGERGEVLLSDFGIAVVTQSSRYQSSKDVVGTIAYMAPEQIQAHPRPASDQYSLGVVAYEWLSGERPFQGSMTEVLAKQIAVPPVPLRAKVPTLSAEIEQVVLTALEKDPQQRFGSVKAFVNALRQSIEGQGRQPGAPFELPPTERFVPNATILTPQPMPRIVIGESKRQPERVSPAREAWLSQGASASQESETIEPVLPPTVAATPPKLPLTAKEENTLPKTTSPVPARPGSANMVPPVSKERATPTPPPARSTPQQKKRGISGVWVGLLIALLMVGGLAGAALANKTPSGSTTTATDTPVPTIRSISATTLPFVKTVDATGQETTPGANAKGNVDVVNFNDAGPLNLPAGSTFRNQVTCRPEYSNLVLVLDASVSLPTATTASPNPMTTVPAHVQQIGAGGNFPFLALKSLALSPHAGCDYFLSASGSCPTILNGQSNCFWVQDSGPFTGGEDPGTHTIVQQSDIDGATNALINQTQPDPQRVLQGQLQSNEHLIGSPQCKPTMSADHRAGDVAINVTVTVTFTCTGEAQSG
jgi:serine/threonine protein kinase